MRNRLACLVLAVVICQLATAGDALAQWRQLHTPHFLFIGDAREGDMRRLAAALEQFRDTVATLPMFERRGGVPTVVLTFASERSFRPYRPHLAGRPVDATGFFLGGDDLNYIAIDSGSEARAMRAVLHEYAHFLIDQALGPVPLWVTEGLAQFYETFGRLDERSAAIGAPIVEHVQLLRRGRLMPMAELMAVDVSSATYHEGDRRGLFYAQSWALVHYLTVGSQERAAQMRDYLAALGEGRAPADAFDSAFGPSTAALEQELQEYVRQRTFRGIRVEVQAGPAGIPERAEPIADGEARAYLADLLARQGRGAEARALLDRLAPPLPARATLALAELALREDDPEEAILRLQRAADDHPDDAAVHATLGRAWLEQLRHERNVARRRGVLQEARTALARADTLDPGVVHTRALLGFAEAAVGDLTVATTLLDDAVARAPGREQYRLMLADALIRREDYERATGHLVVLIERGREPATREEAQALFDRLSSQRRLREAIRPPPPAEPGPP